MALKQTTTLTQRHTRSGETRQPCEILGTSKNSVKTKKRRRHAAGPERQAFDDDFDEAGRGARWKLVDEALWQNGRSESFGWPNRDRDAANERNAAVSTPVLRGGTARVSPKKNARRWPESREPRLGGVRRWRSPPRSGATRKQNTHSPSDSSNSNSASRRRTSSGRTAGSSQPASAIVVVVVVAPRRPENGRRTTNASSHNTRQRLNDGHVWPHQSRRRPARDGVAGGRSSRRPRDLWLPTERPDQVRSTNR